MTLGEFAEAVRVYGALTSASVTSWGRSEQHNREVGGVPYSAHRFWLAVDVVYTTLAPDVVRKELARRLGLRCLIESDHDHLQPWDWSAG